MKGHRQEICKRRENIRACLWTSLTWDVIEFRELIQTHLEQTWFGMARRCWDDIQKTINRTKAIHVFHDMHPGKQLSKTDIDKTSGAWVTSIQDYTFKYWKGLPGIAERTIFITRKFLSYRKSCIIITQRFSVI